MVSKLRRSALALRSGLNERLRPGAVQPGPDVPGCARVPNMSEAAPRMATYDDLLALPEGSALSPVTVRPGRREEGRTLLASSS